MANFVQLSIILTTHAESAQFEKLLGGILKFQSPLLEIIIINDGAGSSDSLFIQNAIKKSANERVFLFEHEQPAGRGLSLNEAIAQASGNFVWAPLQAESLNKKLLLDFAGKFISDEALFFTLGCSVPKTSDEWISAAKEGKLPDDTHLVWNRNAIKQSSLFFNPFLKALHGSEMAFRLYRKNTWRQTDTFFEAADTPAKVQVPSDPDFREFLYTALRYHQDDVDIRAILNYLEAPETDNHPEEEVILQSHRYAETTGNDQDTEIKSPDSLSQADLFPESQQNDHHRQEKEIRLSVIIPTTAIGKQPLESTLLHLEKAVDHRTTELIVIDNASIDDTFDYLEQLQKDEFLNISVITHKTNCGFGASINSGLEAATGTDILVLHNDVIISPNCVEELKQALNQNANIVLAAPIVDPVKIKAQTNEQEISDSFVLTDRVDSCCFMIPKSLNLRFDEKYHLCHFEMDDFCRQITENNQKIAVARNCVAEHHGGATTGAMGIQLTPLLKWKNRERFNSKWNPARDYKLPAQGSHPDRFEKLGPPDNPMAPGSRWIQAVQDYLSDEVKTEILRGSWTEQELITIVSTLLIADERELLRTLEDRLDELDLAPALLILFVLYYFNKNIYSRCRHYLEKAGDSHPLFDLYRLKILVADKELEEASPLLNKMLKKYPASPDLIHLAGDVYRQAGDEGEAKSFYAIANQLDPHRFAADDTAFEIKF
ncbi:MAG: glycosyltransferase [Balneolaceae bacterium]